MKKIIKAITVLFLAFAFSLCGLLAGCSTEEAQAWADKQTAKFHWVYTCGDSALTSFVFYPHFKVNYPKSEVQVKTLNEHSILIINRSDKDCYDWDNIPYHEEYGYKQDENSYSGYYKGVLHSDGVLTYTGAPTIEYKPTPTYKPDDESAYVYWGSYTEDGGVAAYHDYIILTAHKKGKIVGYTILYIIGDNRGETIIKVKDVQLAGTKNVDKINKKINKKITKHHKKNKGKTIKSQWGDFVVPDEMP